MNLRAKCRHRAEAAFLEKGICGEIGFPVMGVVFLGREKEFQPASQPILRRIRTYGRTGQKGLEMYDHTTPTYLATPFHSILPIYLAPHVSLTSSHGLFFAARPAQPIPVGGGACSPAWRIERQRERERFRHHQKQPQLPIHFLSFTYRPRLS
ncbi:hypothetical protein ACLOJK_013923 [Asimina triloba]